MDRGTMASTTIFTESCTRRSIGCRSLTGLRSLSAIWKGSHIRRPLLQLCLSESTIRGRLARARRLLDRRLSRRDASPAGAFLAFVPRTCAAAFCRAALFKLPLVLPFISSIDARPPRGPSRCGRGRWPTESFSPCGLHRFKTALAVIIALGTLATGGVLLTQPTARAQPQRDFDAVGQDNSSGDQETVAVADATPTSGKAA